MICHQIEVRIAGRPVKTCEVESSTFLALLSYQSLTYPTYLISTILPPLLYRHLEMLVVMKLSSPSTTALKS
jgi:hypothetical protein